MAYLAGYMKGNKLTDLHSKDLGWSKERVVETYRTEPYGDRTEAIILTKPARGKNKIQLAAGYSLGDGMLFRGAKLVGSYNWDDPDAWDEAKGIARSESEYWAEKDFEAEQEQEEEQEEEEEEQS